MEIHDETRTHNLKSKRGVPRGNRFLQSYLHNKDLNEESQGVGLKTNITKTKIMRPVKRHIQTNNTVFENVKIYN